LGSHQPGLNLLKRIPLPIAIPYRADRLPTTIFIYQVYGAFYSSQTVAEGMSQAMSIKIIKVFLQPFIKGSKGMVSFALAIPAISWE
tara:strand:+ start:35 stop:295 length:261 start_codon:yes stop_codon:yes gene_type:complete